MSESPLRRLITDTASEHGLSMQDLNVLAPQNDPFRIDTPARHRDGQWLAEAVAELREQIDAINNALRIDAREVEANLPPIEVPEAELTGPYPVPLLDSRWSFAEQTQRLLDSRAYRDGRSAA